MFKLISKELVKRIDRRSDAYRVTAGGYAGKDTSNGQVFTGVMVRLNAPDKPARATLSLEGKPIGDDDRWQFNANMLHHAGPKEQCLNPYGGAGLCVVGLSGSSERTLGVNLLGGMNFCIGSFNAFVQVRLTMADGMHLSFAGGAIPTDEE